MRMLPTLALLLLPVVADAQQAQQARQISALYVSQAGGQPPTLILNTLDGAPKTVRVRDQATGALLGENLKPLTCTTTNGCPKRGQFYGPDEHPAKPAGLFQPPDPQYWGVWGPLKSDVTHGQLLKVAINGRRAIILECVASTPGRAHCARRP